MLDPLILRGISIGFGLLFLLAAVHKISTAQQFRIILEEYQVVPRALAGPVARLVPLVEVMLSVSWLTGYRPGLVALSSAALLAIYTLAIGINLLRGRIHIGCGCGVAGSADGDQQLSSGLLLRNTILIVIALVAAIPTTERSFGVIDYVTLGTALLASALLYLAANQLLANGAAIGTWRNKHD
jgi:hypothetical protein